jgi:hypothetical protein
LGEVGRGSTEAIGHASSTSATGPRTAVFDPGVVLASDPGIRSTAADRMSGMDQSENAEALKAIAAEAFAALGNARLGGPLLARRHLVGLLASIRRLQPARLSAPAR